MIDSLVHPLLSLFHLRFGGFYGSFESVASNVIDRLSHKYDLTTRRTLGLAKGLLRSLVTLGPRGDADGKPATLGLGGTEGGGIAASSKLGRVFFFASGELSLHRRKGRSQSTDVVHDP